MSEQKMREALIIARGALTLEGYEPRDDVLKCIDKALAQPTDVGLTDEERYRWFREKVTNGPLTVASVGMFDLTSWSGDDLDGAIDAAHETQVERTLHCYQCDAKCTYLFPDSRCGTCTRLTPEEIRGERNFDED